MPKLEYDMVIWVRENSRPVRCLHGSNEALPLSQAEVIQFHRKVVSFNKPIDANSRSENENNNAVVHYNKSDTTFLCSLFCCKFLPVFNCLYETGL